MYAAWRLSEDIRGAFTAVDELFQLNPCLFRKPGAASEGIPLCHIVSDAQQLDDIDTTEPVLLDPREFAAQNLDHLCQIETHNDNAEAAELARLEAQSDFGTRAGDGTSKADASPCGVAAHCACAL